MCAVSEDTPLKSGKSSPEMMRPSVGAPVRSSIVKSSSSVSMSTAIMLRMNTASAPLTSANLFGLITRRRYSR